MPRYELWSERECGPDKLHRVHEGSLEESKAMFETLISRWEEEFDTHWNSDENDLSFESKTLPGAEEGCNFVLKDEHGKSLFIYTHEWEVVMNKVYCGQCSHYVPLKMYMFGYSYPKCNHPKFAHLKGFDADPDMINIDNDCDGFYLKQKFKFWVTLKSKIRRSICHEHP